MKSLLPVLRHTLVFVAICIVLKSIVVQRLLNTPPAQSLGLHHRNDGIQDCFFGVKLKPCIHSAPVFNFSTLPYSRLERVLLPEQRACAILHLPEFLS